MNSGAEEAVQSELAKLGAAKAPGVDSYNVQGQPNVVPLLTVLNRYYVQNGNGPRLTFKLKEGEGRTIMWEKSKKALQVTFRG